MEAILVDRDMPGVTVGEREKHMGLKPLPLFPVSFKEVEVPLSRRLGGERGINYMRLLNLSRAALCAMAVGVSRASNEYAVRYAKERYAFGEPIASRQAVAWMLGESAIEVAAMRLMTEEARRLFGVPVILIGYVTPEDGEKALREGKADFIGMNRPLICDPELPNKLRQGRPEDIAPCTRCGTCLDQSEGFLRHCRLNAAVGFGRYHLPPLKTKKKVVVVGAGPAGMEAARVAALRGHDVTLLEKSSHLGGLLPLAALIKGTELEDLPALVRYLKTQLEKTGVKVRLRTEASVRSLEGMKPDVVILATGGVLTAPRVEANKKARKKVLTTPELHKRVKPYLNLFGPRFLGWATRYYLPVGKKVVVLGAGLHGMEVAEFLVKRGRKVTLVEPTEVIGEGMLDFRLGLTMEWFAKVGVEIVAGVKDVRVTEKGVVFKDKEGRERLLEADTVIPTAPLQPNHDLYEKLEGKVPELYLIGDGKQAGMIVHAVRAGYQTAKAL